MLSPENPIPGQAGFHTMPGKSGAPERPAPSPYAVAYFGNDWFAENRTSSHHMARRLAGAAPVLYIETPGIRAPEVRGRDLRKLWKKLAAAFRAPRKLEDQFWLITMPQAPFRKLPGVDWVNRVLGRYLVRRALRQLGFRKLISWFVVPHPGGLARRLGEDLVVYYCIDDYAAFPGVDAASIQRLDDQLTRRADLVFVAPPALVERKRQMNTSVAFSPHGVDVDLFGRAADPALPVAEEARRLRKPVIGYFGTLGAWIDYDLIAYLARERPAWTFLLIGMAAVEPGVLRSLPNVVLTGPKPYQELPRWAKAFDAAIIPYRQTQQVRNANPLKLREYLATGKAVIAVPSPEINRFAEVVSIASGPAEFLAAIELCLRDDSEERQARRRAAVADLSWEARFAETWSIVRRRLERTE